MEESDFFIIIICIFLSSLGNLLSYSYALEHMALEIVISCMWSFFFFFLFSLSYWYFYLIPGLPGAFYATAE